MRDQFRRLAQQIDMGKQRLETASTHPDRADRTVAVVEYGGGNAAGVWHVLLAVDGVAAPSRFVEIVEKARHAGDRVRRLRAQRLGGEQSLHLELRQMGKDGLAKGAAMR